MAASAAHELHNLPGSLRMSHAVGGKSDVGRTGAQRLPATTPLLTTQCGTLRRVDAESGEENTLDTRVRQEYIRTSIYRFPAHSRSGGPACELNIARPALEAFGLLVRASLRLPVIIRGTKIAPSARR